MGGLIEKVILIAVVGLIVYSVVGMFKPGSRSQNGGPLQGQQAPDFVLPALVGEEVWSMQELKGKVVVLSFWASWCGPCRSELPGLDKLHGELADEGLVVLAVNCQDNPANAADFIKSKGITMPVAIDEQGEAARAYQLPAFPTLYAIGRDGIVDFSQVGYHPGQEADIKARVQTLLAEQAPQPAEAPVEPETTVAQ